MGGNRLKDVLYLPLALPLWLHAFLQEILASGGNPEITYTTIDAADARAFTTASFSHQQMTLPSDKTTRPAFDQLFVYTVDKQDLLAPNAAVVVEFYASKGANYKFLYARARARMCVCVCVCCLVWCGLGCPVLFRVTIAENRSRCPRTLSMPPLPCTTAASRLWSWTRRRGRSCRGARA